MKKLNKGGVVSWLILGVLGILLIVGQKLIKDVLYIVMAVGLILAAASGVLGWWKEKSRSKDALLNLLGCLVMLGMGLWIITNPTAFDTLLNVLIGLVLMVNGAIWFIRGVKLDKDKPVMISAAIAVILGLIIACSSAATGWPIIVEGIGLIYAAITGFIAEKRFAK